MRELPGDGQTFEDIRTRNLLYVDKTKWLYPLVKNPGSYFLARPYGFGKTLPVGALQKILEGEREFLKGLWIDSLDYDFEEHSVIKLTMPGDREKWSDFAISLVREIKEEASFKNVIPSRAIKSGEDAASPKGVSPGDVLWELVSALRRGYDAPVAILIDDCDAPIRRVLGNGYEGRRISDILQSFHSRVKIMRERGMVNFVFVTGITKFARSFGFRGFADYTDLTMDSEFNAICGFTPEEFENRFQAYLPEILDLRKSEGLMPADADAESLMKEIEDWYGGYSWDGKNRVLNPWSVFRMLRAKELKPHWFKTGSQKFLVEVARRDGQTPAFGETAEMDECEFDSVDVEKFNRDALRFYEGSLTVDMKSSDGRYFFKRPNKDVRRAMDVKVPGFSPDKKNEKTLN
ncbi:MAG: AAA family ATPase [Deltaproteobacteria bacterium]|nr:AAA family ATPase [Deltaproteobacteria bacterium]